MTGALAALALTAAACTLPAAPAAVPPTNAELAHGRPYLQLLTRDPAVPTLNIEAKVDPVYLPGALTAKAGLVNISFTSPDHSNHNLNLAGPGAWVPLMWG